MTDYEKMLTKELAMAILEDETGIDDRAMLHLCPLLTLAGREDIWRRIKKQERRRFRIQES